MNNGIKALFGAALISCIMIGCESTQTRGTCPDGGDCNPAQCEAKGDCDPSQCKEANCPGKAKACTDGAAKECADKKAEACGDDCSKPCCAAQQVCSHPNSTFECPNCTDGKYCCAGCAAKDAAACPDCRG